MFFGFGLQFARTGHTLALSARVARMFVNGEQGAWYDPSDMSTLFQDAAGTVPVTATGQPVGRVSDISGRGNHATQATAGSRPTFRDVGGLRYLEFDGLDDALVTAAINFSATDELSIFAGVRKNSDTNIGMFLELTANSSTTNGAFAILAPATAATANIGFRSRGTVLSQATPSGIAAPTTRVISMSADISGDSVVSRVDGAVAATSVTDQGAGSYANAVLNIGRRSDTSFPFVGHMYGLLIRGSLTSQAGIIAAERFMATKSGVVIP